MTYSLRHHGHHLVLWQTGRAARVVLAATVRVHADHSVERQPIVGRSSAARAQTHVTLLRGLGAATPALRDDRVTAAAPSQTGSWQRHRPTHGNITARVDYGADKFIHRAQS